MDNEYASSTVFESRLVDKNYQKPVPLGSNINVSNKFVSSATISKDKKTLFFSADYGTKEGYGGLDIYMATLLPTGEWGKPVNVGNIINTPYDEDFPNLSSDGQTLYFASIGHNTMGDYDIFKTTWDKTDNAFSQPVNIGYPVNTPEDNKTISFTSSGRYAYMHAKRDDSYGDLDIYRLIFKDVEPVYSVVNGYILTVDSILVFKDFNSKNNKTAISNNVNKSHNNKDESNDISVKKLNTLEINIEVYNKSDSTLYGKYTPDKNTSRYTIILPPGDFTVNIKSNFFDDYLFDISIMDRDSRDTYINRNIKLKYKWHKESK